MLIIPSFVEEICVDSNIVTGFVINNYTFINPKSITT